MLALLATTDACRQASTSVLLKHRKPNADSVTSPSMSSSSDLLPPLLSEPILSGVVDEDAPAAAVLEDASSSSEPRVSSLSDEQLYRPSGKRFVIDFPVVLDQRLRPFDDAIIKWLQAPLKRDDVPSLSSSSPSHSALSMLRLPLIGFALALTVFTAIEFGLVLPLMLYFTKWDALADRAACLVLMLAFCSQIPKRFLWRARPWMVRRAIRVRKDKTSSFPSRAVTCAVVYGVLICVAASSSTSSTSASSSYKLSENVNVWILCLICLVFAVLASVARIVVGAHFPSDCVAGFAQGTLCALLGYGLYAATTSLCRPCLTQTSLASSCYAASANLVLSEAGNTGFSWPLFLVGLLLIPSVVLLAMSAHPLKFWSKASYVLALLVPCFMFRFIYLCPSARSEFSIAAPEHRSLSSYLIALVLATLCTAAAKVMNALKGIVLNLMGYLALSSILFAILAYDRLSFDVDTFAPL